MKNDMKTTQHHKTIDCYLNTLSTESDKMTQFYIACIIAKNALDEIDKLNKSIINLQSKVDNLTIYYR